MNIRQDSQTVLPIPAMVNSAFATELFLKVMLNEMCIEFDRRKGHSLSYLFGLLPEKVAKKLEIKVDFSNFSV